MIITGYKDYYMAFVLSALFFRSEGGGGKCAFPREDNIADMKKPM